MRQSITLALMLVGSAAHADPKLWHLWWPTHVDCHNFSTVEVKSRGPVELQWSGADTVGKWSVDEKTHVKAFPVPPDPRHSLRDVLWLDGTSHVTIDLVCSESNERLSWTLEDKEMVMAQRELASSWHLPSLPEMRIDLRRDAAQLFAREFSTAVADLLGSICAQRDCGIDPRTAESARTLARKGAIRSYVVINPRASLDLFKGWTLVLAAHGEQLTMSCRWPQPANKTMCEAGYVGLTVQQKGPNTHLETSNEEIDVQSDFKGTQLRFRERLP